VSVQCVCANFESAIYDPLVRIGRKELVMGKKPEMLSCLSDKNCNGYLIRKRVSRTIKLKNRTVTVPDVEVWECDKCGEYFFPYEASKKMEPDKKYSGRIMVRLKPETHRMLDKMARKHHRSLNQEINHLMERATSESGIVRADT